MRGRPHPTIAEANVFRRRSAAQGPRTGAGPWAEATRLLSGIAPRWNGPDREIGGTPAPLLPTKLACGARQCLITSGLPDTHTPSKPNDPNHPNPIKLNAAQPMANTFTSLQYH